MDVKKKVEYKRELTYIFLLCPRSTNITHPTSTRGISHSPANKIEDRPTLECRRKLVNIACEPIKFCS